jgi:fibronectin type 3 domain-containing protein
VGNPLQTPSAVTIGDGYLTSNQTDSNGNLTTNFWRSIENMYITPPSGDVLQWGVSQGAAFRRMYVNAPMELTNTNCGEASGGFMADTVVNGNVNACSQQQWYTRNSSIGSFSGNVWNFVFSGVTGAPAQSNPFSNGSNANTALATTPVSREKPFLYTDGSGNYWVFSPSLLTNSSGASWAKGGIGNGDPGTPLAISTFLIATPSSTLAQINSALASGQNLILTPGIYQYSGSINVTNPNTVVLGLGYADLVPQSGTAAITVADVSGVQIAGLLIDAGPVNSPVLFQVGVAGASRVSHASNPTSINDVFLRIGGATQGTATESMEIDSDNVILDNIWAWRADHGQVQVGWTVNVGINGLVVNGDNVTALGVAVEHYEAEQVLWNGEGGETIFYQSEMPYDVPSQSAWMDGSVDGYASYNVSPTVTAHSAYGIGVYSFFNQGVDIIANSGISVPVAAGVNITDALSVFLAGSGQISYTIASDSPTVDNAGTVVDSASILSDVSSYGGSAGNCSAAPTIPGTPSGTGTSSSQINVSWGASTAGTSCTVSYNLFRSTTSGFTPSSSTLVSSTTGTAYLSAGLAASTTYYYVVEAIDSDGASAASNQASAETSAASCTTVPSAPTGLTATASSSSAIGLIWTAVAPPANCTISSYSVYGSTTSGFTPSSSNLISNTVTSTSYSVTGLSASTTYYYVVEATDAEGNSAASAQESATTLAAASGTEIVAIACGGPAESNSGGGDYSFVADEDFSGGGDNSPVTATINLTQPGANAAPMGVYRYGRAGAFTYTIPGLTAGSTYTVLLHFAETYFTAAGDREFNVAINGTTVLTNLDVYATVGKDAALLETFTATANSSGQIVIAFTLGAANQPLLMGVEIRSSSSGSCSAVPSAPGGLTPTASSSSAIALSWGAVTPPANCTVSSYSVYGSTASGFTPSSSNLIATVTGTTYSNTGLAASTTYYYVVEAMDADGTSAASAQQSATTQAASGSTEVLAIACGGPAESNSGGGDYSFVADEDFSGGGDNSPVTATINLTQPGANAAAMAVYQHGRAGVTTYTIPGLAAGGSYTVLLHFAETYFTAAGDREFNVAINGTKVLTNLDIYGTIGNDAALLETFNTTANSSGKIVVAFTTGAANQPLVMGIEVRTN